MTAFTFNLVRKIFKKHVGKTPSNKEIAEGINKATAYWKKHKRVYKALIGGKMKRTVLAMKIKKHDGTDTQSVKIDPYFLLANKFKRAGYYVEHDGGVFGVYEDETRFVAYIEEELSGNYTEDEEKIIKSWESLVEDHKAIEIKF